MITAMKFRRVGRWGLEVSVIGLGTWPASVGDDASAMALVRRAYDLGVRYFDTANFYEAGGREVVVGQALAQFPRESYVLATKVSFPIGDPPNNQGLSRKHIVEQCEASLRRLGVSHIDLYQCHRFEPDTPLVETCRAMDDLIRQGKIVYWGVTSWPAAGIRAAIETCRAHGFAEPVSDQEQYSALWRQPEAEVFPECERHGLGGVAWSPLAMGVLAGRYTSLADLPAGSRATKPDSKWMTGFLRPEVIEAVGRAQELAGEHGVTVGQLALAWCLSRPTLDAVVIGASTEAQLVETVGAAELVVDVDVIATFDDITEAVRAT
jgi:aryl-alcohol dehydrogenase-like predicted oxidoreductase